MLTNFFNRFLSQKTPKKKRFLQFQVPIDCKTREEKNNIILDTIDILEHKIKIKK